jgi:hypothetical protein
MPQAPFTMTVPDSTQIQFMPTLPAKCTKVIYSIEDIVEKLPPKRARLSHVENASTKTESTLVSQSTDGERCEVTSGAAAENRSVEAIPRGANGKKDKETWSYIFNDRQWPSRNLQSEPKTQVSSCLSFRWLLTKGFLNH